MMLTMVTLLMLTVRMFFDVTPMLDRWWVGDEVFKTFIRQYARHKSAYVEQCFDCGEMKEIGQRQACYACFRVFGIGCEGEGGTCSFACADCGCIICRTCLNLGVGNTCNICEETYCSHCRSDAQYQACSDCPQKKEFRSPFVQGTACAKRGSAEAVL